MRPPVLLLIDGEWLLPRRPRLGLWTMVPPALDAVLDSIRAAADEHGTVRRTQCFRSWTDQSVTRVGSVTGALQRRLVELHHIPAGLDEPDPLHADRVGVARAIRSAAVAFVLTSGDAVAVIAGDGADAMAGLEHERVVAIDVPTLAPLWRRLDG